MVPMTLIWWIYHFWARFWPYFNFVDFRAYFGHFSLVNGVEHKNLSLNINLLPITLKFFLWPHTTQWHEWLKELSSIKKRCNVGHPTVHFIVDNNSVVWNQKINQRNSAVKIGQWIYVSEGVGCQSTWIMHTCIQDLFHRYEQEFRNTQVGTQKTDT